MGISHSSQKCSLQRKRRPSRLYNGTAYGLPGSNPRIQHQQRWRRNETFVPELTTPLTRPDPSLFTEPSDPAHMFNPIGSKATVCAFSCVPNRVVTGHLSGKVAIFDYKSGEEVDNNERAHGDEVTDLQTSPDRTYFITSSKDKAARVSDFPFSRYITSGRREAIILPLLISNHHIAASNQGPQSPENIPNRNPTQ